MNIISKLLKPSTSQVVDKANNLLVALPYLYQKPFLPDAHFYAQYSQKSPSDGLNYMADAIFKWLKIERKGAVIDFYAEKDIPKHKADTAGFYTTTVVDGEKKELIFINAKYSDDPMAVGAILAHELMHLYLFRLSIKIEDTHENELLTDIATIRTGLSLLVLNGMKYTNHGIFSILLLFFGVLYWRREKQVFGYFKPEVYARLAAESLAEKNIEIKDVIGHINPYARYFLPQRITNIKSIFFGAENPTEYIRTLEKKKLKTLTKQLIAAAFVIGFFVVVNRMDEPRYNKQMSLKAQVDLCKSELALLDTVAMEFDAKITKYDEQLDAYKEAKNEKAYNEILEPRNNLLKKLKEDVQKYDEKVNSCNALVDQYNATIK